MMNNYEEIQNDELDALEAIFGDDCRVDRDTKFVVVKIRRTIGDESKGDPSKPPEVIRLELHLPTFYPFESQPFPSLVAAHVPCETLTWACKELSKLTAAGEVCIYNWINWIQEQPLLWDSGLESKSESNKKLDKKRRDALACTTPSLRIITGEPYTERNSTFQAHVAAVHNLSDVDLMMDLLLQNSKIAAATHNILAYRIINSKIRQNSNAGHNCSHSHGSSDNGCRCSGGGNSGNCNTSISPGPIPSPPPFHSSAQAAICIQDYDDDGETHAGARLLHLLQVLNVTNVAVVVSRWFGGTLLGPSRFAIINDTARRLLNESGPWGTDHRRVGK